MGLSNIVKSRGFRNFMAKLYGIGAAVVILGALFKINHYQGADIMLIMGLGTEATSRSLCMAQTENPTGAVNAAT